ncbi:MAG: lipase family protein [Mycobacteriales bacterium]
MSSRLLSRLSSPRAALLGIAVLTLAALSGSGSATTGVPLPSDDGFYRYAGSTPLREIAPGTPLRERTVTLGAMTNETPLTATQVLYRTTDTTGHAVVSVTTVVLPVTAAAVPRVVAYLSFYDAFTSQCDPSFTLRGGEPGSANDGQAEAEQAVVQSLRAQGYVVTVPDFENETLDFMSGTESGMSALDAVKATLVVLKLGRSTPVGVMGYSGGSLAADWASELAPRYAPQLNLVGVAEGGMPVDLAHILRYVDGSPKWSSITPAILLGLARAYHVDLTPYLSAYGAKVVEADSHECIGQFAGNLTLKQLLKPQYVDVVHVPVFRKLFDALVMGSAPGHPTEPLLVVAGNLDGTGDGVTIAGDMQALAREYCRQGVPVDYEEVTHGEHTQTGFAFMPEAFAFLGARFAGAPPVSSCGLIGAGSPLATARAG